MKNEEHSVIANYNFWIGIDNENGVLRTIVDNPLARLENFINSSVEKFILPNIVKITANIVAQQDEFGEYYVAIYRLKSGNYLRINAFSLKKDEKNQLNQYGRFREFVLQFREYEEKDIPPDYRG